MRWGCIDAACHCLHTYAYAHLRICRHDDRGHGCYPLLLLTSCHWSVDATGDEVLLLQCGTRFSFEADLLKEMLMHVDCCTEMDPMLTWLITEAV